MKNLSLLLLLCFSFSAHSAKHSIYKPKVSSDLPDRIQFNLLQNLKKFCKTIKTETHAVAKSTEAELCSGDFGSQLIENRHHLPSLGDQALTFIYQATTALRAIGPSAHSSLALTEIISSTEVNHFAARALLRQQQ